MSSGVSWSEDYSDPDAEIHRFDAAMSEEGSLDVFLTTMTRDKAPGTNCRYNSAETQAFGALLVQATGRSITDYKREKLFQLLGMAFAGLGLTARDFAKIGELYRNNGV